MEKFPFTPEGVEALCQQLYQLADTALALEAAALATDFNAWVKAHFLMTPEQVTYLESLHTEVNRFLAFQTSFAVGHRLPIVLNKPTLTGVRASKLFDPKASITLHILPDQSYTAVGQVTLDITY